MKIIIEGSEREIKNISLMLKNFPVNITNEDGTPVHKPKEIDTGKKSRRRNKQEEQ